MSGCDLSRISEAIAHRSLRPLTSEGRVESQPYDVGETSIIGTRYLSYDALGRLTSEALGQQG